jgi:hypothetical protein
MQLNKKYLNEIFNHTPDSAACLLPPQYLIKLSMASPAMIPPTTSQTMAVKSAKAREAQLKS